MTIKYLTISAPATVTKRGATIYFSMNSTVELLKNFLTAPEILPMWKIILYGYVMYLAGIASERLFRSNSSKKTTKEK